MVALDRAAVPETEALAAEHESPTIRQLHWRLLPFLFVAYVVSYIDRANIGVAALQMNKDVGLSASVFGLGGALYSIPLLLGAIPANLALERFGARRALGYIMIATGIAAASLSLVQGPISFISLRILLGAAESGFFPGVILYITYWYPREYRAAVVSIFMLAIPVAGSLGSPLSAALLGADGWLGLHGWQYIFIIEGTPAVLLGLFALTYLADKPELASWLRPEARRWLSIRLASERVMHGSVSQVSPWRAICHWNVVALGMAYAGSATVTGALNLWLPQVIKSIGLTNLQTGALTAMPYLLACGATVWWAWRSDAKKERNWHVLFPLSASAVCMALCWIDADAYFVALAFGMAAIATSMTRGPFWALCSEYLSRDVAAIGLAAINVIGTSCVVVATYSIGLIKDATGGFAAAAIPLGMFAAAGVIALMTVRGPRQADAPDRAI